MARLHSPTDHDFPPDRAAAPATDLKTAKANAPARTPPGETWERDLDDVFEEPSRRPF